MVLISFTVSFYSLHDNEKYIFCVYDLYKDCIEHDDISSYISDLKILDINIINKY